MINFAAKIFKYITSQRITQISEHLSFKRDKYNAIHLTPTNSLAPIQFQQYMEHLLEENTHNATTSIWVHLTTEEIGLAAILSKQSFTIHHGKGNSISMYRWLSKERSDMVVPYSMFHLGCGGVIINDDSILLIQQKRGELKGRFGIPGGRADQKQGIKLCSQRQVYEQLGIKAQFNSLLWIRQLSSYLYGSFDVYFACLIKIKICDYEIQKTEWVPLKNYRSFAEKNSFGTQKQLANYVCDLYESGYDFKRRSVSYQQKIYTSPLDKKPRFFGQHKVGYKK